MKKTVVQTEIEKEILEIYQQYGERPMQVLRQVYKRYTWKLILSFIFNAIQHLPVIVLPIVTARIIALVLERPDNMVQMFCLYGGFMILLCLLNIPATMLNWHFHCSVARDMEAGLRMSMVRKLQQMTIASHKAMQSGRIQSKLMRDVEAIHALSQNLLMNFPAIIISAVSAVVVVLSSNRIVFLFFLICVPLAVLLMRVFRKPIKIGNQSFRRNMETASANLMDMVEMTQITRAHGLENKEVRKMGGVLRTLATSGFKLDMVTALFGSASWVIFELFQFLCLLFSSLLAIRHVIGVEDIAMYQQYFSMLTGQVASIVGMVPAITKGLESVSSVGEILRSADVEDNRGKTVYRELRGEYEFRDVHFAYEDDQPLLQGMNMKINAGETVAFVGESGSGKTTMLNLLIGFNFPSSGTLLVDGQDIRTIDLHSYRKHISTVPQNSVMFTGTIRENITYGMKGVTDEQLYRALDAARLTDFVNSLPNGVDTMLAEHGGNLSGGQRQRLSIARALIRDPEVIILDEATSALDSVSERQIQDAINNLTRGRTTFIVAHRLSTIKNADKIAVIQDGRCVEMGNFEELMEKKGEFYKLRSMQQI